jgi:hypothetical protein
MDFSFICALFFALVCSQSFIVHEWGTFTSVQGSNGKPLGGSHHGEERLPAFVHSRADTFTHEMWEKLQNVCADIIELILLKSIGSALCETKQASY